MKRPWLWILLGFALFFLALAGAAWLYLAADEPPPSDADLLVPRVEVPEAENGFAAIADLRNEDFAVPEDWSVCSFFDREWRPEAARAFLASNEGGLARLDACIAKPRFQPPRRGWNEPTPWFGAWRRLAQLGLVRAGVLFEEGKTGEALDRALDVAEYADRLERSGSPVLYYAGAVGMKARAIDNVNEMAIRIAPGAPLGPILDRLERLRGGRDALGASVRESYRLYSAMLDDLARGEGLRELSLDRIPSIGRSVVLHPNRTKRVLAEMARALVEGKRPPRPPKEFVPFRNVAGALLFAGWDFIMCKMRPERIDARISATRLLLALRLFQAQKGNLPMKLDELVPGFLNEVPPDPFDGKPFRYSREENRIWSIGEADAAALPAVPSGPPGDAAIVFPLDPLPPQPPDDEDADGAGEDEDEG